MLSGAQAQTALTDDGSLRLSVFGTAAVSHVQAPPGWGFRRDVSQKGAPAGTTAQVDSRAGLLLNYSLGPRVEFAGQAVAVPRAAYTPDNELVRVAYAAVRPTAQTQVRLGRLAPNALLMSEYRHVGFGYVMVRPPVEFYNLVPSVLDGLEAAATANALGGRWRTALIASRARVGDYAEGPPVTLTNMRSAAVSYEQEGLLLRAFISRGRMAAPAARGLRDGLAQVETLPVPQVAAQAAALREALSMEERSDYRSVSLRKEWPRWQLQAEAMRVAGLPFGLLVRGGYVNLARELGNLSLFGQYGVIRVNRSSPALPQWEDALSPWVGASAAAQAQALAAAGTAVAGSFWTDQQTGSLGARWALHPHVALKTQWDRVFVRPGGGGAWQPRRTDGFTADIASVALDFVW